MKETLAIEAPQEGDWLIVGISIVFKPWSRIYWMFVNEVTKVDEVNSHAETMMSNVEELNLIPCCETALIPIGT